MLLMMLDLDCSSLALTWFSTIIMTGFGVDSFYLLHARLIPPDLATCPALNASPCHYQLLIGTVSDSVVVLE